MSHLEKEKSNAAERCPVVLFIEILRQFDKLDRKIMTQVSELEYKLNAISAQLTKASAEITNEIANLRAQLNQNGELPAGADAALANLTAIAQALDDINPDQSA